MALTSTQSVGVIWMILMQRKRLMTLMVVQEVGQRELAAAAGWKSHSYLGRLLRGEVNTLEVEPAVRIAQRLGVGVDDLFVARVSNDVRRNGEKRATKSPARRTPSAPQRTPRPRGAEKSAPGRKP